MKPKFYKYFVRNNVCWHTESLNSFVLQISNNIFNPFQIVPYFICNFADSGSKDFSKISGFETLQINP